jgi:hypothetical protein
MADATSEVKSIAVTFAVLFHKYPTWTTTVFHTVAERRVN